MNTCTGSLWLILFSALYIGVAVWEVSCDKVQLYIGGLFTEAHNLRTGTKGYHALVGAQMATEDINRLESILPDYDIVLLWNDTQGSTAVAMNGLYEMFYKPPVRIAMVGPVLSFITVEIAAVAGLWQFLQVSGAATSPALGDREKYPTFFRTVSSAAKLNLGYLQILKELNWKRVAILTESTEPHTSVSADLESLLVKNGIRVVVSKTFDTDNLSETIKLIKAMDVRTIFGNFYEATAFNVFCKAYKHELYGRKYTWFIKGLFQTDWWLKWNGTDTCSIEQVKEASAGYFCATYSVFGRAEMYTATGITPDEFRKAASKRINYNFTMDGQEYIGIGYDAMVALALALNVSQPELPPRALENYMYGDTETTNIIKRNLYELSFDGVSGRLSFNDDGGRVGDYLLKQNRDGGEQVIGTFNPLTESLVWNYPDYIIWQLHGGAPPREGDYIVTNLMFISSACFISVCILCSLGCTFACFFLCFNILKRNERQVKMSSPNINNVIVFGIVVVYLSIVLLGIDSSLVSSDTLLRVCKVRIWLIAMSFTLVFGGMFTKMWRVYSIVVHNRTKRKVIKDSQLFLIVAVLLFIDVLILVPHEILDPYQINNVKRQIPQTEEDVANYIQYEELWVQCYSKHDLIWLMLFVVYKTFVMIFGVFLTWQTRNINVPALNDSYYVGLSIYNTILCLSLSVPISIINAQSLTLSYALVSCLVLFCVTTTLAMLFIPKLRVVYGKRNVVGNNANPTFFVNQQETTANVTSNIAEVINSPSQNE